jgi:hypothetical protein
VVEAETAATDPVRQLLHIGRTNAYGVSDWPDYAASFGIGDQHIDALIAMATDSALHASGSETTEVWAPLHACRALGQLRAEAAIRPLLRLLREYADDDAIHVDVPLALGLIGPAAIPSISAFMTIPEMTRWPVTGAQSALREIAQRYPGSRDDCVAILARCLAPRPDPDITVNGFAVSALIELKAVEAIADIRDAFGRGDVDISIAGDIEDVEIELGLREERETPRPRYHSLSGLRSFGSDEDWIKPVPEVLARRAEVGRNEPCPCGSGKKYKKCCLN